MKITPTNTDVIKSVSDLLSYNEAKEFVKDLDVLMSGYLSSDLADDAVDRAYKFGTYKQLISFFNSLSEINKI